MPPLPSYKGIRSKNKISLLHSAHTHPHCTETCVQLVVPHKHLLLDMAHCEKH